MINSDRNDSFAGDTTVDTPTDQIPNPYAGVSMHQIDPKTFDPIKYYKLPADPWHIICRWRKNGESSMLNVYNHVLKPSLHGQICASRRYRPAT